MCVFGGETPGELGALRDEEVGHLWGETWRRSRGTGRSPGRQVRSAEGGFVWERGNFWLVFNSSFPYFVSVSPVLPFFDRRSYRDNVSPCAGFCLLQLLVMYRFASGNEFQKSEFQRLLQRRALNS